MNKSQKWSTARVIITISGQPAASAPLQVTLEDKPVVGGVMRMWFILANISRSHCRPAHLRSVTVGVTQLKLHSNWSFRYQVSSELRVMLNGGIGQLESNKDRLGLTSCTGLNFAPATHPPPPQL